MSMKSTSNAGSEQPADSSNKDQPPAGSWATLSFFEITVNSRTNVTAPVYANGRQRIPVQVELVAHDESGNRVTLTPGQLLQVKFITYETSSPPPLHISNSKGDYEYHWSVISEIGQDAEQEPHHPAPRGQTVMFYVSADSVDRTVRIAAAITSPANVLYTTNTRNPTAGEFDSWIIVDRRPPIVHQWTKLAILDSVNLITLWNWDVDLYYIGFKNEQNENLRLVGGEIKNAADGKSFYSWPKDGWARKSSVAYRPDYERTTSFPDATGISFKVNDRYGLACAARISSKSSFNIPQSSSYGYVTYYDQHGNSVPATITPSTNGNTLSLGPAWLGAEGPESPDAAAAEAES